MNRLQFTTSHPLYWRSIIVLLFLSLPTSTEWFLSFSFPVQSSVVSFSVFATCTDHIILVHMIVLSLLAKSIIHESHHSAAVFFRLSSSTSSLGRNVFLRSLPEDNFEVSFSLIVTDQVTRPCQMGGKIIILCILVFNFSPVDTEVNILNWMDEFNMLLI